MGDIIYRPLIEDMTWSYSRLKSFESCPYQWFCKYICGDEEEPMFYASYGSFMHRLIEDYFRGVVQKDELPFAFLSGFSSNVLGDRPSAEIVQKYIRLGKQYFEGFNGFPFETVSVEDEFHFDVDGLKFVAFVDYIGRRDGKLAIVDHKSRDLKPRSSRTGKPTVKDRELDEMLMQLYLYAHGVYQRFGELPKTLCFNCLKSGQLIEEPFDRRVYVQTLDWAKQRAEEIADEEDFKPNMDYFRCKYLCGLHNSCCYYQGG